MNVEILQDGGQRREEGRCQQLAQVLSITLRMLEKAREDDWQTVADLEHKRRELLALCFRGAATPEQSELVAESLAVMLHLNEELMSLLRMARDSVLQKANLQSQTRTALGEYVVVQHQATRSAD
ncbi:MAG: flagellar protein FliT [Pseudomonadota bacterium]